VLLEMSPVLLEVRRETLISAPETFPQRARHAEAFVVDVLDAGLFQQGPEPRLSEDWVAAGRPLRPAEGRTRGRRSG
jgi:hypothetical protein